MKKIICAAGIAAAVLLSVAGCSSPTATLVGTWGDTDATDQPSLVFEGSETDGDYSGTDGCNQVGGAYTVEGGTVNLGMMRATLMYCDGVDTWLSQARTATIDGSTLTLLDERGGEIGTLERAAG